MVSLIFVDALRNQSPTACAYIMERSCRLLKSRPARMDWRLMSKSEKLPPESLADRRDGAESRPEPWKRVQYYEFHRIGHLKRDCPANCYECGQRRHLMRECPSQQGNERVRCCWIMLPLRCSSHPTNDCERRRTPSLDQHNQSAMFSLISESVVDCWENSWKDRVIIVTMSRSVVRSNRFHLESIIFQGRNLGRFKAIFAVKCRLAHWVGRYMGSRFDSYR